MIILFILLIITFFYAIFYKSHKSLHMLQQNLYNENNRYLKWVIKNLQDFISFDIGTIAISLVGVFVIYDLKFVSYLCFAMLALFLILIGYRENKNILNDQNKKKLVVTARVKRLIVTLGILHVIPMLFIEFNLNNLLKSCLLLK